MINLIVGEAANRVLTLAERMTNRFNPVLFEFINVQTEERVYCNSPELSPFPLSFNRYRFKAVVSNPDPTQGEFIVENTGLFKYNAYEMSQLADYDPENAIKLLERGLSNIINDPTSVVVYESNQSRITYEKDI
jgi:hypothetical protein